MKRFAGDVIAYSMSMYPAAINPRRSEREGCNFGVQYRGF